MGRWLRGGGLKEKGLMDMHNRVMTAGGGLRGINGNGKKYNRKAIIKY